MLVEDLSNGFAVVCDLGCSDVLVPCLRSAAIIVEELVGHSAWVNKVSAAKAAGQSQEARTALWEATRFPVFQNDKMRPVDDFSRSLVNASVTREKIRPDGVDAIAGNIVVWLCTVLPMSSSTLRGSNGLLLPEHRFASVIVLCPPDAQVLEAGAVLDAAQLRYFISSALPFGALAVVNQFNRVGEALKAVATKLLWLPVTSFYDDFVQ
eukprot:1729935-Amphidinium_carterae.1